MKWLLDYFNLNRRQGCSPELARKRQQISIKREPVSSPMKTDRAMAHVHSPSDKNLLPMDQPIETISPLKQIVLYFGVVIGVAFSSSISGFQSGQAHQIHISFSTAFISAVIGLILLPVIHEKLQIKSRTPLLIRFGLFVQQGVFWQVLMNGIGKAL